MAKGEPNKRYAGGFKQEVVETMMRESLAAVKQPVGLSSKVITVCGTGSAYIWKKAQRGCA